MKTQQVKKRWYFKHFWHVRSAVLQDPKVEYHDQSDIFLLQMMLAKDCCSNWCYVAIVIGHVRLQSYTRHCRKHKLDEAQNTGFL